MHCCLRCFNNKKGIHLIKKKKNSLPRVWILQYVDWLALT